MKMRTFGLACVLASAASVASAATVVNGDFETDFADQGILGDYFSDLAGSTKGGSWDVWESIPGWTTSEGPGIEIQSNNTLNTIDAHSGNHYVELNSHGGGSAGSNSSMFQTLALDKGTYLLSFWYSPRNGNVGGNSIDYGIAGATGTVSGPDGTTAVGSWTEVTLQFMVDSADDYTLFFSATGEDNKNLGGLIDTISVSQVPVPASAALLLAGLGGLGLMRRRKS